MTRQHGKPPGRRKATPETPTSTAGTVQTNTRPTTLKRATATADAGDRPLENRVDCFGTIFSSAARGLFMGNRGGRIHDPDTRRLDERRWTSKSWICCETAFKQRTRDVWGQGYTELFFLDEVTALAAGHRPCFECRRTAAQAFAAAFARGNGLAEPPSAPHMDKVLHAERLDPESVFGREKKLYVAFVDSLPDGAVIACDGEPRQAFAIRGDFALPWSPEGYGRPMPRPRRRLVTLVTPPSTVMALNAGYAPAWHPSAAIDLFERTYSDEAAA